MASAPYFKIDVAQAPSTGAGVISTIQDSKGKEPDNALDLLRAARGLARMYICRAVAAFLFTMAMLAFLSFISISQSTDLNAKYLTSIAIVVCLVGAMHWRKCSETRGEGWNPDRSVVIEMVADAWRLGAFVITYPLMVLALYNLVNKPAGEKAVFFEAPGELAAAVAAINALLLAVARIGTDELWDIRDGITMVVGLVAIAGSTVCLIFVVVDFANASQDIPDAAFMRSFLYIYIGSAAMSGIAGGYRFFLKVCGYSVTSKQTRIEYVGTYPEALSLVKDLVYGMIDCYALGIFALWITYTNFGKRLFNQAFAVPYEP